MVKSAIELEKMNKSVPQIGGHLYMNIGDSILCEWYMDHSGFINLQAWAFGIVRLSLNLISQLL